MTGKTTRSLAVAPVVFLKFNRELFGCPVRHRDAATDGGRRSDGVTDGATDGWFLATRRELNKNDDDDDDGRGLGVRARGWSL